MSRGTILLQLAMVAVLPLSVLCEDTEGTEGGENWVSVCKLLQEVQWTNSDESYKGAGSVDIRACTIEVQPCGDTAMCTGRVVPMLTATIPLSASFSGIRGTFTERSTSQNLADDCLGHQKPATRYGQRVNCHGGITVFGTDKKILYPGCGCKSNCALYKAQITEQDVPETTDLIIESHQSVPTEVFVFELNNLEVRLRTTTTVSTSTGTSTTNTQLQALQAQVKALAEMGHSAKIEDLTKTLAEFVADFEADKAAVAKRDASVQDRLAALEAALGDGNIVSGEELATFKAETMKTLTELTSRFQAASDAAANAGEPPDEDGAEPEPCSGDACVPTIEAVGSDLFINAPGGNVKFASANCIASADICDLQRKVENIIAALYSLGTD